MAVHKIDCKFEEVILSIMRIVGIELEIEQEVSGINMSYNFITDKISYDPERIYEAKKELHKPISLETYLQIFTLHELGHALDRESLLHSLDETLEIFDMKRNYSIKEQYNHSTLLALLIKEHQMNIQFEKTAWDNARKLNKEFNIVDRNIFDQVQVHSLRTYTNLYERDFKIYNQLLLDESSKVA